ncbi:DUF445 domain-containing protein [Streptomyces sp. WMMB 322]|uniref:DUF445 domain-containing protein n=1 Tax=Streptomyces sp. WMMB 322 TaxID=1286821 RepID=UPI000823E2E8|nr:DUF445 family protein [Streptomyces sp. WMMB 322]SCK20336.1 Uncharacterized membrane-anchored protein YjiN, DUF445 family [Streptomyces sp. WMMB 322]
MDQAKAGDVTPAGAGGVRAITDGKAARTAGPGPNGRTGSDSSGRSAASDSGAATGSGAASGSGGRPPNPGPLGTFTAADEERRRGVRRMKTIATGALLLMAVVFVLAKWAQHEGAGVWSGYVAAAAEAGMVGALADWFAVTALFRHPLGLPIPHTAIIPTKKDQLGHTLGEFVGENFLSADVVRSRLRTVGIAGRLGSWLAQPEHADRVTSELSTALRGTLAVLRDSDVQAVVGEAITRRADAQEIAPALGSMLERVVADQGHRRVVDLVCGRAAQWLEQHSDSVVEAVTGGAPGWTPRFIDRRVGDRVYRELLRFVTEMRDMPEHPARGAIDRFLTDFAADLRSDPQTRARVERLKSDVLGRSEVQDLISSAWNSVRSMIVAAAEDESSQLRLRARASLLSLGKRMASDGRLRGKVDGWIEDAAVYVVTTYRNEITSLITETVAGWDAGHTSKKIEAHIGRDLQFIRLNGTVVGSMAGLAIYALVNLVTR